MSHPEASAGQWKCGDAFQYPLPRPNGDPWEVLLEPYLKKDKLRCDTWKDEVQTLLIFAGLFSAVVTSFVVTSVQTLQEDPNDVAVQLLARIADQLANVTTGTITAPAPFAPSASAIRINTLWFISLVLSLSTVLVGIVALQWLREHQRYTDRITPQECVGAYHMREESLERWLVPQIFTGLPLLLQIALVLFFVGVAEYLCALNRAVGIPVSVSIALALFFLGATTVLPTLQLFLLALSGPSTKIPAQCAYKSPQSWAMHRLFAYIFSLGSILYVCSPFPKPASWDLPWIPLRFGLYTAHESWIAFDAWWLRIRNCYSMAAHGVILRVPRQCLDERAPQHDVSAMLTATIRTYTEHAPSVLAAYACFAEVSRAAALDDQAQAGIPLWRDMGPVRRIQLFRCQNWPSYPLKTHPRPMDTRGLQVMHEEHLAFFMWSPARPYPEALARDVGAHLLELRCRILQFEFSNTRLRMLGSYQNTLMDHIYKYYRLPLFKVSIGRRMVQHISLPGEIVNESIQQLLLILRDFFQNVDAEYESWFTCNSEQDENSVVTLKGFLEIPASLLDRAPRSSGVHDVMFHSPATHEAILGSIFQVITVKLDSAAQNDFMFFSATHFLYEFFSCPTNDLSAHHRDVVGALLRSLARYEARLQLGHHRWTREEPDLWSRNYLWEDPGRYRIGMWTVLLAAYNAQPAGANAFEIPLIVSANRLHDIMHLMHRGTRSVRNVVPEVVDMDGPRPTLNLSVPTSDRVPGQNSTRSSVSVDEKDNES